MQNQLLFELGTEEIPADMIPKAVVQLQRGVENLLKENQVSSESVQIFNSPRRLAILIKGLPDCQSEREEVVVGPPRSVAFDTQGNPTRAAHGFARRMGVEMGRLEIIENDRGAYLCCRFSIPGRAVPELLAEGLVAVISSLTWPKNMYWRESRFRFIRPLRWFVCLWNDRVIPFEFEGVTSARLTRGHRILGSSKVELADAGSYVQALRENFVLVDLEERRRRILAGLEENTPQKTKILPDPALLETVLYLNEFPTVIRGEFDSEFLKIPQQVLITVMRHHQKYFALVDGEGNLAPFFLTVINTAGDPDGRIRNGHEKVLKARLQDAAFFWQQDRKTPLEERIPLLKQVLFQDRLGTYFDKTQRIRKILKSLGQGDKELENALDRAASLCKVDLTTEMVRELTELQGIMGGLYAREEGRNQYLVEKFLEASPADVPRRQARLEAQKKFETVWRAIFEHYQPVSMEDSSPQTKGGALLSIADRIDTIVGCFEIGLIPTGSSDPFAVRRQAQGLVKILLDHRYDPDLDIALDHLVDLARKSYSFPEPREEVRGAILDFLKRRVRFLLESQGFSFDILNAVLAVDFRSVKSAFERAEALTLVRGEKDFEAIAVAFKRIKNILAGRSPDQSLFRSNLLLEKEEQELHQRYIEARHRIEAHLASSEVQSADGQPGAINWPAVFREMASLRSAVDLFFDKVLVMAEDENLRQNRLCLLDQILKLFLRIADISEIVQEGAKNDR